MQLQPLYFQSIMERDLFYYDPQLANEGDNAVLDYIAFCDNLGLSYLPSLDRRPSYFELIDGKFEGPLSITSDVSVNIHDAIFSPAALEKFRKSPHNVLFVMDGLRIEGVVHLCDYNKTPVLMYYYAYLLDFEKKLRELLVLKGFTNEDMIEFYKSSVKRFDGPLQAHYQEQLKKTQREKHLKWLETLGSFQSFPIADLLWFVRYLNLVTIEREEIDELRELRNTVMHGQDAVYTDGMIFSIESLERHFSRIDLFRKKYGKLLTALDRAILNDRRQKNKAKWKVLSTFTNPFIERSRIMWHYLED